MGLNSVEINRDSGAHWQRRARHRRPLTLAAWRDRGPRSAPALIGGRSSARSAVTCAPGFAWPRPGRVRSARRRRLGSGAAPNTAGGGARRAPLVGRSERRRLRRRSPSGLFGHAWRQSRPGAGGKRPVIAHGARAWSGGSGLFARGPERGGPLQPQGAPRGGGPRGRLHRRRRWEDPLRHTSPAMRCLVLRCDARRGEVRRSGATQGPVKRDEEGRGEVR